VPTSTEDKAIGATGNPTPAPGIGEPDATYVDPDLSRQDNVGILPPDEQAWFDAREAARDQGVEVAEAQEEENIKERQRILDEQAEKNEELQEIREKIAVAAASGAQPVVNIDL
jgi:hypothetical protein